MEKFDIVIQGNYTDHTDEIISSYLNIPFVNKIIVSCWANNKSPEDYGKKVSFIRNQHPFSSGTDNKNLQIVSSLNGLKECEADFTVKNRSDQKFNYDSMMRMYEFTLSTQERILVSGIYNQLLFCPRDHTFWGKTKDLIRLFDIPLEVNSLIDKVKISKENLWKYYEYFIRTETYLGAHYCSNFNEEIYRFLLKPEEHLYDNAIYWYHCKNISDIITPTVFKSFPKSIVYFDWFNKKNFSIEDYHNSCCWDEEGF